MSRARGFTLLELLAATVLLGLVVGTVTMRWSASGEAARSQEADAALRDLDARARLWARAEGPIVLRVEDDGARATLRAARSGEAVASVELPRGATVRVIARATRAPEIVFDRAGRSPSYRVEWRSDGEARAWSVSGPTGWITEDPP